jgi:glycine cleavage system H protein
LGISGRRGPPSPLGGGVAGFSKLTGMQIPADLKYSSDHEWAKASELVVRIGITDYAQDALGDVVFVDLPKVGASVVAGGQLGEVESTKSVSEIYAPVTGTVSAVNESLNAAPELLNSAPYGDGWICEVTVSTLDEFNALLTPEAYAHLTNN